MGTRNSNVSFPFGELSFAAKSKVGHAMNRNASTFNRTKRRGAFTIVEMLVTVAVIALLLGLILPAVMSARGAARRLECENRLRQFGVALQSFESTHRYLPFGTTFPEGEVYGTDWVSVQVQLLPYLEQTAAYRSLTESNRQGPDALAMQMSLPVFHCPDEEVKTGTNYRTCTGLHAGFYEFPGVVINRTGTLSGGFGSLPGRCSLNPLRLSDITDGLSNTAAMSERLISKGPGDLFVRDRDIWYSGAKALGFRVDERTVDESVDVCRSMTGTPTNSFSPFAGRNCREGGFFYTSYNHAMTPNSETQDCSFSALHLTPDTSWSYTDGPAVVTARSNHSDRTVCLLLMDGAVRIIPPQVDRILWRGVASRADGDRALE
jgi:type II secretory pathway pseudopilin PulG